MLIYWQHSESNNCRMTSQRRCRESDGIVTTLGKVIEQLVLWMYQVITVLGCIDRIAESTLTKAYTTASCSKAVQIQGDIVACI